MELTFDSPLRPTIVDQIHDKVTDLAVSVAVLTTQHKNVLEAVNRIEMAVSGQMETSEEYRATLLTKVTAVTDSVRTMEYELDTVKKKLEELSQRGFINAIRKNAPVVTIALAVLTVLWAVGQWLRNHLHW